MPVQDKAVRRKKNVGEKVQCFENLSHIAAANKDTDLVTSLYDEFI